MDREDRSLRNNILFMVWLLVPVLIFQINYNSGSGHFTLCLIKNITGKNCYGCGVLRGISACLHFNFPAAYRLNHLNLLTLPLLTYFYGKELWFTRPAFLQKRPVI